MSTFLHLAESSVRESASSRTKEEAAHHKLRGILKEITEVKSKIHHALRQGQDQILAAGTKQPFS